VQLNWVIDKLLLLNWTGSTNFSFNYWCVLYVEDLTVTPSKIEKKILHHQEEEKTKLRTEKAWRVYIVLTTFRHHLSEDTFIFEGQKTTNLALPCIDQKFHSLVQFLSLNWCVIQCFLLLLVQLNAAVFQGNTRMSHGMECWSGLSLAEVAADWLRH
jgi:hypothetical protein